MKIQKSYMIFGDRIKIRFVKSNDFAGLYDHTKKIIYISSLQPKEEILATFFHEIIHCIQYQTGVNQAVSRELLEVMAETTSKILVNLIN